MNDDGSDVAIPDTAAANGADSNALFISKTIHNLRDVGGLVTDSGGKVRSGVLFRSAQLGERNDDALKQLTALDLEIVFDLRSDDEVNRLPDFVPDGVTHVQLDVLADSEERIAAQLEDLFVDPLGASELLMSGVVHDHYVGTYRNFVNLQSAGSSYSQLFTSVAQGHRALFHCTAGKDRTGWAAASLQLLLGVSQHDVIEHFLMSNPHTLALFGAVMDAFVEAGGNPDALAPVFMVDRMYLEAAMEEVDSNFGSIENYFVEGLGLGHDGVAELRRRLIQE
ncbi:MAG: tyrosine-protein phosphatase [Microthrixaceae bacterium]|nr:tyrosine-protein phosphatase [Microthrixaceae bacterium]